MDICVNCKHHRKEGRAGIRCWYGVVETIQRDPVTGTRSTTLNARPTNCTEKRRIHPDTCPDYIPTLPISVMDSKVGE
ncbi:hypothetical protein ACQUJS_03020 [Ralstonia pseudosolanacearum]|uniref:Uncharacterized protein n=1 Tax=Ralstonia solanacearum TaxID=305 RepID=A0A0S4TXR9_RALSL|nr:hypothetical protein RSP799_07100 [Ralstonia solanacearum]CUV14663.1 conserved protein of unknown function [Ralstonia solanacearum]